MPCGKGFEVPPRELLICSVLPAWEWCRLGMGRVESRPLSPPFPLNDKGNLFKLRECSIEAVGCAELLRKYPL